MVLSFYSYGVMLRKTDGERISEFPVDPAQVAAALSAKVRFDTGLLSDNTLLVRQEGVHKIVIEYRRPQKTGLYFEGSDNPLRVPLPGLVLVRVTTEDRSPAYQFYAVKGRLTSFDEPLYHAPLPNIFASGSICWGNVSLVSDAALQGTLLQEDWAVLLGTRFGDHAVGGKSKSHPNDIRQKLIDLENRKARTYPKSDLIPAHRTLAQVLGETA